MPVLQLTPGEVVLGNRIRSCFPARVADEMLPHADDDLIQMVRKAINRHTITIREARTWVVMQFHKMKLHAVGSPTLEITEQEMMRIRINYFFAGRVGE